MTEPRCLIEAFASACRFRDVFVEPQKWLRQVIKLVSWPLTDEVDRLRAALAGPAGEPAKRTWSGHGACQETRYWRPWRLRTGRGGRRLDQAGLPCDRKKSAAPPKAEPHAIKRQSESGPPGRDMSLGIHRTIEEPPSGKMLAQGWSVRSLVALICLKRRRQAIQPPCRAGYRTAATAE